MRLKGRVVLLTGASSGIGWAAARAFAAEGAALALLARRADKLEELAASLKTETFLVPGDVSQTEHAQKRVDAVVSRFGRVDVLVNNAGVTAFRMFAEQDLAEMEDILRVNYLGSAALIRAALPGMLARKDGHVVNVASIAGLFGMPQMAAYSASKFALVGLTEALRREHLGTGVHFTSFCPGSVTTPMTERVLADPKIGGAARPKTPEQVAEKLVRALLTRPTEVVYGEAPGGLVHLSRFVPRFADWCVDQALKRLPRLAQKPSN